MVYSFRAPQGAPAFSFLHVQRPMNLTESFLKITLLGAEWVMWLLIGLSVISITIMIERMLFFLLRRVNIDKLSAEVKRLLRAGEAEKVREMVENSRAVECRVLAAGLSVASRGVEAASEAMLSAKARERLRMEANLAVLGTLGNNAPFIGLLGTVLGIIKAAHDLTAQSATEQASASAVMAGVFEALVATAIGLFVAIPAVMAFNYFQRKARNLSGRADVLAHLLLSELAIRAAKSPPKSSQPVSGSV
jgi:biopolymer transport protein ExbB/TolQ